MGGFAASAQARQSGTFYDAGRPFGELSCFSVFERFVASIVFLIVDFAVRL